MGSRTTGFYAVCNAAKIATALSVGCALTGCAMPYLDTAQSAYRVDPVLVQWHARNRDSGGATGTRDFDTCPRPPEKDARGLRNTQDQVDVLCPVDLDTFKFPQDRRLRDSDTAYSRLLSCQERVAPMEQAVALAHELESLQMRLRALEQQRDGMPSQLTAAQTVRDGLSATSAKLSALADDALKEAAALGADATAEAKQKAKDKSDKAQASATDAKAAVEVQDKKIATLQGTVKRVEREIIATHILIDSNQKLTTALTEKAVTPQALPTHTSAQDQALCMVLRNQLQEELMARSAMMCKKHLADVKATAALYNSALGFSSLAQSSLAAIVTGQTWARVLATGASIATGSQAIVNKEIYKDVVVPAITRAIDQERTRRENIIRANRQRTLMEYSAGQAISDAAEYHEACSFATGLELIGNDAEKRVEQSIPELEARIKAISDQIKATDDSLTDKSSDAEKKIAERSKTRMRSEIQVLQALLKTARQTAGR